MLTPLLQRRGQGQQRFCRHSSLRKHRQKLRLALRQRPRLVQKQRIDLGQLLQYLGAADEQTGLRAPTRGHHDRHRRRQPQRTRTGNDHHRYRAHQCLRPCRLSRAENQPRAKAQDRSQQHQRHKVGRHPVRQPLDLGPSALRPTDHAHDLRQHRVAAHALDLHQQRPRAVDRAANQPRRDLLGNRHRLPGQHRLIDTADPFQHRAIGRNLLTRQHPRPVSGVKLAQRHIALAAIGKDPPRHLRHQAQQRHNRLRGLAARPQL